jgi:hypothetical protein
VDIELAKLIVNIVDVRKKRADTFTGSRFEVEKTFLHAMDCLCRSLVIMEKELRPHLARGSNAKEWR